MKKNELKKMLKPLIKECIKEVIFEEGTLSTIISEVVKGTSQSRSIVETKPPNNTSNDQYRQKKLEEAKRRKKKLLDSIGRDAFNGVNVFEGTNPMQTEKNTHGPLSNMDPQDPGVDINRIFSPHSSAIWKKLSGK